MDTLLWIRFKELKVITHPWPSFYGDLIVEVRTWMNITLHRKLSWTHSYTQVQYFKQASIVRSSVEFFHMKNINCNKILVFMWLLFNLFIYSLDLIEPTSSSSIMPWWRHPMETFSAFLAICAGNSPATAEFLAQRPVKRRFDVFFDLCLNKRVNNGEAGDLRRHRTHYDVTIMIYDAFRLHAYTNIYMDQDCAGQFSSCK